MVMRSVLETNVAERVSARVLHPDADGQSALALALGAIGAASEACATVDADRVLRLAACIARDRLGLERVAFFLRDPHAERFVLRGTWSASKDGELDVHALAHELPHDDVVTLSGLRATGAVCMQRAEAPWVTLDVASRRGVPDAWVALTPLLVGDELIGVMYNDAGSSQGALDTRRQAAAALFCNFIAISYVARRDAAPRRRVEARSERSPLVQRIVMAIDESLPVRGHQLAREFGVSPGHLARAFKREMGISLVDYRNQKRLERFREAMQQPGREGSLKEAALAAGFGSYAQFHRIHHKFMGRPPRRSQPVTFRATRAFAAVERAPGADQEAPVG